VDAKEILSHCNESFDIVPFLYEHDKITNLKKRHKEIREYYRIKNAIASYLQPKSILEIGVRAGYSAVAFLSAVPTVSYLGIDAENGQHGGTKGYMEIAKKMLTANFPQAKMEFLKAYSHSPKVRSILKDKIFDMAYVDADHSYKGCLYDLELVAHRARYILVDDITFIASVGRACKYFLEKKKYKHIYMESLKGECLIRTNC